MSRMAEQTDDKPVDQLRAYRLERYEELRFTELEANKLADATDRKGFPVSWHNVRKAVESGMNHRRVVDLFT